MKAKLCLAALGMMISLTAWAASGISYDGTNLDLNNDFVRTESGTMKKKTMKEVSGMAASRRTEGFLWAHGDENKDEDKKIIALKPDGSLAMTVMIAGDPGRDDWEDIATGALDGKNYVFIGAFGDNDLAYKDDYYIYFFEEPEIQSGKTVTVNVKYIRFGYPDAQAHNTETLMYDNIEHTFYIADKTEGAPCTLYSLPFKTDDGTGVQKLTKVCSLGTGSAFELVCGGDITPDGHWMAVKNEKVVLLWERQGTESLSETARRRPVQIVAYEKEEQGESLAWESTTTFYTTSDSKKDTPIYKYARKADHSLANVTSITVDGKPLEGFEPQKWNYDVEVAYGRKTPPVVAATAGDDGVVAVEQAKSLPGTATVICTSNDGKNSVKYTINFVSRATPSEDASLKNLSINGTPVEDFAADKYGYACRIAYLDPLPVLTAEATDENATLTITNVTEVTKSGTDATVTVTAQDGKTQRTYTVTFTREDAIKRIDEVVMTNSYNAYINAGENIIHAFYLAGTEEPEVKSYRLSEGTVWTQSGNQVTLTGADGTTEEYTLLAEPVTPVDFTGEEIVFDGSEGAWVKSAYGWDDSKKWRFSKTDTDYSREIAGRTHVELFLSACDTVVIKSMSKERAVRFYVNGEPLGDKTTLTVAGNTLVVLQKEPFMLTVASAQSSGDGGIAAIRMARKETPTGVDETPRESEKATKVLKNNTLYILRNGRIYTVLGYMN